jgi:hypothetical protein
MKVLLFDCNFECFASLSPAIATVPFLKRIKEMGGSFLHVPIDMVGLISGKDGKEALDTILRDIEKI